MRFSFFALSLGAFSHGNSSTSQHEQGASYETLDGGAISVEELIKGRWALGFIVFPGCPACEKVVEWFGQAAQAFPEVKFVLIAPTATPELKELVRTHAPGIPVILDRNGELGAWLGVERVPTILLSVEGIFVDRLDWPFTEGSLLRKLAESLLVKVEIPNPEELLGQPAPDFSATNLEGKEIALGELPRPILLVFFSLGCAPCWEILPMLEGLSQEVAVGLVAVTGEDLSQADRERLEGFLKGVEERNGSAAVLLDREMEGEGFKIVTAYKVGQSPTFILIDGKGVVVGVWQGHMEEKELLEEVRAALAKAHR